VICCNKTQNIGEDKEHVEGITFVFDIPTTNLKEKKELDKKE